MDENFIVDFGEVNRVITEDFNKLNNRPSYAGELMTGDTDIPQVPSSVSELNNDSNYQTGAQVSEAIEAEKEARETADTALDGRLTTVEGIAATALQPSSIDKVVMTDINVGANTSTTTFNLDASKQNLLTGATSSKQVSMPVASSTEAGIMNSATFDAVVNNTANINALANGAVAITGLPSSPTQAQLTTAWENATGETSLMNRAGIYDVTNGKVWTYYTNDTTWHSTTNTTQVTINTFTNSSEGTIKGSTNVGQVFAEADGTGSVNGWDALNDAVGNNSSDISNLQTAVNGKQDKLIAGTNINIAADGKTISATDTTYTAGNAINITNGEISADIHPADFFTASDSISECGSNLSLDNTIASTLKSVELKGDTFQQTYSGKNILYVPNGTYSSGGIDWTVTNNTITGTGTVSASPSQIFETRNLDTSFGPGTYTFSISQPISYNIRLLFREGTTNHNVGTIEVGQTSATFTTDWTTTSYNVHITGLSTGTSFSLTMPNKLQLETGSQPTSYEPYTGGIPAPNPDYPQDVQVVTGEQAVEVSDGVESQSYLISLGSIELCKIGNYQDYIYKSGDDWYAHKAIAKYTFTGTETWSTSPYGTNTWRLNDVIYFPFDTNELQIISNIFTGIKHIDRNTTESNVIYSANNSEVNIRNTSFTSLAEVQAATNGNYVYYALATPTDTKITDATLVTQLNALAAAKSYNGQTNVVVTATGANLPAALCVGAYQKSLNGLLGAIERLGE